MVKTESEHRPEVVAEPEQDEEARTTVSTKQSAVPQDFKYALIVAPVAVLSVLSEAGLTGSTWASVPVCLGAVLAYIAGAMYLFKHLMDYDSVSHYRQGPPDAS